MVVFAIGEGTRGNGIFFCPIELVMCRHIFERLLRAFSFSIKSDFPI